MAKPLDLGECEWCRERPAVTQRKIGTRPQTKKLPLIINLCRLCVPKATPDKEKE